MAADPPMLVVFTGPSLDARAARAALPTARVEPPACRGDIARVSAEGASNILLIDGGFAHRLAVAPGEIVGALRRGIRVIGTASLGAIRAAECHPAGMEGVGAIQYLYRLRVLADDDEVAVATEPERDFRASSIALVNVRFAALAALRHGRLDRAGAAAMLAAAKRLHFSERIWDRILQASGAGDDPVLRALCLSTDVKRRDAERAVAAVAGASAVTGRRVPAAVQSSRRGSGHDPDFGFAPDVLREELLGWLVACGRFRLYWPQPPEDLDKAWCSLEERRDLEHELMRFYAVRRGAGLAGADAGPDLGPYLVGARETVARAHGYPNWNALAAGPVAGGGSLDDRHRAAQLLALARRNLARAPVDGV